MATAHLKLLLKLGLLCWVLDLIHAVEASPQVSGGDFRLPTDKMFVKGLMQEHILVLHIPETINSTPNNY